MGSGGRNPGRGACPKIIYDRKAANNKASGAVPRGLYFFAKIQKKMLALARNVCYNIDKKRGEGYKKESPSSRKGEMNHDEVLRWKQNPGNHP